MGGRSLQLGVSLRTLALLVSVADILVVNAPPTHAQIMASDDAPLSAIEWLNQTPTVTLQLSEPPVSSGIETHDVSVDTLDAPSRDSVGLLPASVTGLPATLWQNSHADTLGALIAAARPDFLPAMQALLYTLLLAEANPPADTDHPDALLQTRIDKLFEMGALEQAEALVERAGPDTPALFSRWFDITLLLGREERTCQALLTSPNLAPNYATLIFCTARGGNWDAAVLTLGTANALGLLTPEEDMLLARFLDPDLFEGLPLDVAPGVPSPLTFRLYEAIGEAKPTAGLPRAFAHADVRNTAGWKARLDAAERLARTGALPSNRLLGIYSEGKASASGMIWDRVTAIQSFDTALEARDPAAIAETLPAAWSAMQTAHLEVPFANLYGSRLLALPLTGVTKRLARDIGLLSPSYEQAALSGPRDFLASLALGIPPLAPADPLHRAISDAFHDAGVPQEISTMLALGQLGEVILRAMDLMETGAFGDLSALTHALAIFRAVGLEDTARRAALQAALLDFRG